MSRLTEQERAALGSVARTLREAGVQEINMDWVEMKLYYRLTDGRIEHVPALVFQDGISNLLAALEPAPAPVAKPAPVQVETETCQALRKGHGKEGVCLWLKHKPNCTNPDCSWYSVRPPAPTFRPLTPTQLPALVGQVIVRDDEFTDLVTGYRPPCNLDVGRIIVGVYRVTADELRDCYTYRDAGTTPTPHDAGDPVAVREEDKP